MKYLLFLSILMMFLIGFSINVYAEDSFSMASAFGVKELKSLELFVNASDSLSANTNLTTYYFINSSDFTDGISKIVNVKLRIVIDKISAQPYMMNMYVNGSSCLYSGFDTSLGVGQYVMYFDCTNRFLNQTDVMYKFDFNADKNAGNVFVLFMPTYVNNPEFNYTDMTTNIWNYTNRTLTYYPNDTEIILYNTTTETRNIQTNILNSISNLQTNITLEFTNLNNNIINLQNNITTQISNIPYLVWNYLTPNNRLVVATNVNATLSINSTNITMDLSNRAILKIIEVWCLENPNLCKGV